MLTQLIRQEAMDAYAERWLGEVSSPWAIPPLALALTGLAALTCLVMVLIFGVYTRQTTLYGVINGSHGRISFTASQAQLLRLGETLPLEIRTNDPASRHCSGRITSLHSAPATGGWLYRIDFEIPSVGRTAHRFLVRVPQERHRLYQWMFLCSPN